MNKGLDLIARQQPEFINDFPTGNISIGVTQEELTELEKELKDYYALKKECDEAKWYQEHKALNEILALHDKWLGNHQISDFEFFTLLIEIRDKYGLLKEVLKDE